MISKQQYMHLTLKCQQNRSIIIFTKTNLYLIAKHIVCLINDKSINIQ